MADIEMVIDSIRVSLMNYQRVVILREKEGERCLPCWIGPAEADAIAVGMQNIAALRPLTHDLLCSIASVTGFTIKMAIVNKLEKDTFYAKLVLASHDKSYEIDCRPSDAFAVALRVGAPIFVDENVLSKATVLTDEKMKGVRDESEKKEPLIGAFSESAQDVLKLAEEEAKRLKQDYVGTGHLLLALVKKTSTAASIVLANLGLNLARFPPEVEAYIGQQSSLESAEAGPTSAVKQTIELSIQEAKRLASEKVQPEHFVLGMIRQGGGVAATLLKSQGINVERVYIELIKLCTQSWRGQQS